MGSSLGVAHGETIPWIVSLPVLSLRKTGEIRPS